jgi:hypothetical protein
MTRATSVEEVVLRRPSSTWLVATAGHERVPISVSAPTAAMSPVSPTRVTVKYAAVRTQTSSAHTILPLLGPFFDPPRPPPRPTDRWPTGALQFSSGYAIMGLPNHIIIGLLFFYVITLLPRTLAGVVSCQYGCGGGVSLKCISCFCFSYKRLLTRILCAFRIARN